MTGYVLNGGDVTEARQAAEDLAAARDGALMASKAKSRVPVHDEPRDPHADERRDRADRAAAGDRPRRRPAELASGVKVSAENLLVIINDILDFSKIEAGKLDLEEADLDVPRRGRRRRAHPRRAGPRQRARAARSTSTPTSPRRCSGDGVRIQQVLLNLGSNAVKFTAEGEVVIRVGGAARERRAGGAALRRRRHGHRHRRGGPGAPVPRLRPGRLLHDPQVRRHRPRTRHLPAARGAHGWRPRAGQRARAKARRSGSSCRLRRAESAPCPTSDGDPRDARRASGRWSSTTTPPTAGSCASSCSSWGVEAVEAVDGYQALELALQPRRRTDGPSTSA